MFRLLKSFLGPREPTGRSGERIAAKWLQKHKYRILERNLAIGDDEADLVALDPDGRTIVIVEVKTRTADQSSPEQSIHRTKQFRLNRLASGLQKRKKYRDRPIRFDAIAIVLADSGDPIVRHIPGAFESRW